MLRESLGLSPEQIEGRSILDAGCGAGRYSDVLARWGGRVVSMDLSDAVEACHSNLGARGVLVIQGDIFNPPLADGSFDCIVSIGVLDHTPNPKAAFDRLVRLLKPGGVIGFWVYHAYNDDSVRMKLARTLRRFTPYLPPRLLYALCHLAVPWYYLNRVPVLRSLTGRLWHSSDHPQWRWRVLDTFDWYSPRYLSHHTHLEVWDWFRQNGLTDIRPLDPPVAMTGRKP
jgi:SAM-dependent methyltransferase